MAKELQQDPFFDASKHDDLWILRFVLSHCKTRKKTTNKTIAKAVEAAKTTLAFRKKHNLDDEDIRAFPPNKDCPHPKGANCAKYFSCCDDDAMVICIPNKQRCVISFFQFSSIDQEACVEKLEAEQWLPAYIYTSEFIHQWLDYISRRTGRLTKNVRVVSMEGVKVSNINSEHERRNAKAMAVMEDCYPQLLQSIIICEPPAWIQVPWRMIKVFFPKRVTEKLDVLSPRTNLKERKILYKHVVDKDLPIKFGGQYPEWPVRFPLPDM